MTQFETDYFKTDKMITCPCGCNFTITNARFWHLLNRARFLANTPFVITSGARCLKHNRNIGSDDTSSHIKGIAVDIAFKDNFQKFLIVKGLFDSGFTRVGYDDKQKIIHCDLDDSKPTSLFNY